MTFLEKQIRIHTRLLDTNDITVIKDILKPYLIEIKKIVPCNTKYYVTYTRYRPNANYNTLVNGLVRDRYSESEEFAILRKAINNPDNAEFIEYNEYVENCKLQAKAFIAERDKVLALNR